MIESYYSSITFLTVFALLIMVLIVSGNHLLSQQEKNALKQLYLLLILAVCSEWTGVFLNGKPSYTILFHGLIKATEYSLLPYLCIQFLNVIHETRQRKLLYGILGIHAVFEFSSIFTHLSFYVDENNVYQYGSLRWIYTALCIFCCVYTIIRCFQYTSRFQSSNKVFLVALVSFVFLGIALRQLNREIRLELLSITFMGIFMYIYYVDTLQKSDSLTGLLNQDSYKSKISHISGKAMILYFDIDEFKKVNDTYGHVYGDKVLNTVGKIIKEAYAKYGFCYRVGGDEFCVILENEIEAMEIMNAEFKWLLKKARKTEPNFPTVSVGWSMFDSEKDVVEDVIGRADQDMYRTKTKLRKTLHETNMKLFATVQAFQIAAEASSTLVFVYDLKEQSILVDEKTAKAYGIKEKEEGIPYEAAKAGIISEDTVEEYIRIHEAMIQGAPRADGIVKLIQIDGTETPRQLSFRAVYDEKGNPTGTAVGVYTMINTK